MIAVASAAAPAAGASPAALAPPATPRVPFAEVLAHRAAPAAPTPPLPAPVLQGLEAVERAREGLDAALSAARAGKTFSAQELLALQADAYRFQRAVDVAAKVAEAGAQSVRQAVNTQL